MEAGSAAPVRDAFEAVAAKADSLDTIFNSAGTLPDLFEARRRVKDGVYSAQKTNNFSTVRVDMTIENRAIADCEITSFGDGDLLTDEIRASWAQAIVDSQSAAPDAITSATLVFSAGSVQEAVEDILLQAVGEKEADPIEEPPAETAAPEQAEAPEEQPAETAAPAAAEAPAQPETPAETDPMRLMRDRPAIAASEAAAEQAPAETDPTRLMRERPAIAVSEAAAEAQAQEAAPAETDPSRLMRERPVIAVSEAAAEQETATAEDPAETDPARLMRERPASAAGEAAAEQAPAEAEAPAQPVSDDIDRLMRRQQEGLATPKQIRCLERYGFRQVGTWLFDDASLLISRLADNNWRVPYGMTPELYRP